jgi:hypothetical protein
VTGGTTVALAGAGAQAYRLAIEADGMLQIGIGTTLTVEDRVTHRGRLQQTQVVNDAVVPFLYLRSSDGSVTPFYGVMLDGSGQTLGGVTVSIYGDQTPGLDGTLGDVVRHWYDIAVQVAPSGPITAEFAYPVVALNGNNPATLNVYHYEGEGAWALQPQLASGSAGEWRWIEAQIGPGLSPFVLKSDEPTVLGLQAVSATGSFVPLVIGALGMLGAALAPRKRR